MILFLRKMILFLLKILLFLLKNNNKFKFLYFKNKNYDFININFY